MYLKEKLPKNKDINLLERKEAKHPLLQIIKKNAKKENNDNDAKENNILNNNSKDNSSSFFNLFLQKRKSAKEKTKENKITPKKNDEDNNRYIEQNIYSEINEDKKSLDNQKIKNKSRNENKIINLSKSTNSKRKSISVFTGNSSIFPFLSLNKSLFGFKKKSKDDKNKEKDKSNDNKTNNTNNINFNNNSIYVSENKQKYSTLFNEKFIGDKVLYQKSVELNFMGKNSDKDSLDNINLKDNNSKTLPQLTINSESININKNETIVPQENNSNKNNLILNFKNEKNNLLNFKINNRSKRKSVNFSKTFNFLKKDKKHSSTDTDKIFRYYKRRSSVNVSSRREYPLLNFRPFNTENKSLSPNVRRKINVKKISNKRINIDNLDNILSDKERSKTLHYSSKKDINKNPLDLFYNTFINHNKYNINKTNTDSEYLEHSDKIIILQSNPSYYHINSIINKKYVNKDEDDYLKKKRLKIFQEVENVNKDSNLYNNYKEEIKNYFLKNCAVDRITERIFENFEPFENKIEDKHLKLERQEKELKKIFHEIVNKCNRNCYSMNEIVKRGESLIKGRKIIIKIKINNHYILEKFDIYPVLLNQFQGKWNSKRRKEYYYKKMIEYISSLNEEDLDPNNNKRNSLSLDKNYFIYKERITNDLNLNLKNKFNLNSRIVNELKTGTIIKRSLTRKRKSTTNGKKIFYSKQSQELKNPISLFSQENPEKNEIFQINTTNIRAQSTFVDKKTVNSLKIQKELGFTPRTESFEKFAKLYRIQKNPINSSNKTNNENEDKKIVNINNEKEIIFNNAKISLDNYNILKNRKIFNYTNNNQINFEKRFSQMYNYKKNKIQLDKKMKIDTMTIKFAGIDQLTKEASLIKTQEIEKDLPDVKLFDKFVSAILRRKINLFDHLIQKKEEAFNRIINKQEFSTGNTLLIYAIQNNLKSLVELLLLKGANPNIQNKFGNSALHIAYKNDNAFIINLLLEYHAEQKLKNRNGLLPWQMSRSINN